MLRQGVPVLPAASIAKLRSQQCDAAQVRWRTEATICTERVHRSSVRTYSQGAPISSSEMFMFSGTGKGLLAINFSSFLSVAEVTPREAGHSKTQPEQRSRTQIVFPRSWDLVRSLGIDDQMYKTSSSESESRSSIPLDIPSNRTRFHSMGAWKWSERCSSNHV